MKERMHLLDPGDIDDRRAMYANELLRVELKLHAADRFAEQIAFGPDKQAHVLTFCCNQIDFVDIQQKGRTLRFDKKPISHPLWHLLRTFLFVPYLLEQRKNSNVRVSALFVPETFFRPTIGSASKLMCDRQTRSKCS